MEQTLCLHPIGFIRSQAGKTWIEIDPRFEQGLLGLDAFSHIEVFFWFHQNDTPAMRRILRVRPMKDAANPLTGVFATHSPQRPNLIGHTICRLIAVQGTRIELETIDAFDGSPVIDIKCYTPRRRAEGEIRIASWAKQTSEESN